ncbi:hypothetical protein PV326_001061 [Microctonus aethiopoides]|nr:hypothetical protein PV326_001061 [Microctonus aethiopoides]
MFVFNDDVEISYGGRNFNCSPSNSRIDLSSGIMDPVNKQVETDLMWSFCSEIHFENYANSRYSCGLLNYPMRTMEWENDHQIRLTLQGDDFCNGFLHCVSEQGTSIVAEKPLDGTPCAENAYEGICREHECV